MSTVPISTEALIAKFKEALDNHWGYIYGKTHEMWTQAKQDAYRKQYLSDPEKYSDHKLSAELGGKWIGHWVTDCSGLFAWAFAQLGGKIAHGSNSIWNAYCSSKGNLKDGKRTDGKTLLPGTAVFTSTGTKHNHIGLYVGIVNGVGTVIEAQGTKAGVTTTKITNSKWTNWGELKEVSYGSSPQPEPTPEPKPEPGTAIVTGVRVALRKGPTTSAGIITRIDTGEVVKITTPPSDWEYVTYNGKSGYMMKAYLKEG